MRPLKTKQQKESEKLIMTILFMRSLDVLSVATLELKAYIASIDTSDKKAVEKVDYMNKVLGQILNFVFDQSEVDSIKAQGNFLSTCYEERLGDTPEKIFETMELVVEEYYETAPEASTPDSSKTVYILMHEWTRDDVSENRILGVYLTEKAAKKAFAKHRKSEKKFADTEGYTISTDTDSEFESYVPGFYDQDHTVLYIKEMRVEEESV